MDYSLDLLCSFMKKILMLVALSTVSGLTLASENTTNWNSFYAGANIGYGWGKTNDQLNSNASKQDLSGFTGGFQIGHNWQLNNNIVLGLETNLAFNNIKENWKDRDNNQYSPYYGKDAVKEAGSLTVKAGYAIDKFLPYVLTGVTVAKTNHEVGCDRSLVSATNGCKTQYNSSNSNISVGATVGAGVSYKVTDNLSTSLEYQYTNLGKSSVHLTDPNYPAAGEREFKTSYSTTALKLNYHF